MLEGQLQVTTVVHTSAMDVLLLLRREELLILLGRSHDRLDHKTAFDLKKPVPMDREA